MISTALLLTHDHTGHNGFRRTYAALKQLYYWKGMKKDVLMHCKHCQVCAKQKVERTKYIKDNFRPGSMPMESISMDLVGRLSKTSSGHEYALTVICMLRGFMFCIPLKTNTAQEIVDKYLTHVAFTFRNRRKILSDNGTEFKNTLFEEVAKQLGVERKIYSLVYRPQANGCIEGFHKFLKECISKHMVNNLEWDDILPLAATAYNWFPNEHSKEPAFFLMFRQDVATHFTKLIKPKWRYLGDVKGLLKIEQLQKLYQITAYNLLKAREHYIKDQIQRHIPQPHLSIGNAVLVRDHAREQFRPRYKNYRVTKRLRNARVEVCDNHGKLSVRHISDVKQVTPLEWTVQQISETTGMGHKCTFTVNPDRITDLQWQAMDRTLLDNLAEIAGKASKISDIISTWL